jgi:hypothetical protein
MVDAQENFASSRHGTAIPSLSGNIMNGLHLMTTLVVAMLGGAIGVCALIALIVFLLSGICTRLFKDDDRD